MLKLFATAAKITSLSSMVDSDGRTILGATRLAGGIWRQRVLSRRPISLRVDLREFPNEGGVLLMTGQQAVKPF